MILIFRYNGVPNYALPFHLKRGLFRFHGVLNSAAASICGWSITYGLQSDMFLSVKIAACLSAVGYHLRVTPFTDHSQLIEEILSRDHRT